MEPGELFGIVSAAFGMTILVPWHIRRALGIDGNSDLRKALQNEEAGSNAWRRRAIENEERAKRVEQRALEVARRARTYRFEEIADQVFCRREGRAVSRSEIIEHPIYGIVHDDGNNRHTIMGSSIDKYTYPI
jgi:predicted phage-related endonuclease